MKILVVDTEPSWNELLNAVVSGHLSADGLRPAVKIADVVRQAQKKGLKQVIFRFPNTEGAVEIETETDDYSVDEISPCDNTSKFIRIMIDGVEFNGLLHEKTEGCED